MRELLLGLTLGFSAGLRPGPVLALVLTTSLRHGRWAGVQVSASPLVTDLPIIVLALTILSTVPGRVVATIGTLGAGVVLRLGICALRQARHAEPPTAEGGAGAYPLGQGVVVNLLSPRRGYFG